MSTPTSAVGMSHKLAAIFSTDVAGYSRLMGDDEEATIRTLTVYRAVISSLIQQHRGRVVDKDLVVLERHIAALRKAGLK